MVATSLAVLKYGSTGRLTRGYSHDSTSRCSYGHGHESELSEDVVLRKEGETRKEISKRAGTRRPVSVTTEGGGSDVDTGQRFHSVELGGLRTEKG